MLNPIFSKKVYGILQYKVLSIQRVILTHPLVPLQWRHNGRYSVSNHQPHHCLLNRLFRRRSKKTSKPRVTGLCSENSPETGPNICEILIKIQKFSFTKKHLNVSAAKRRPFCPVGDELKRKIWENLGSYLCSYYLATSVYAWWADSC